MLIRLKDAVKKYGKGETEVYALDHATLELDEGKICVILGPSGSGKSTLLNCLSTIDCASAGDILFNGVSFDSLKKSELAAFRRHNLGFIFQNYNLLDTLTLGENISLSLLINGAAQGTIQKRIHDIANQVGIGHLLDKLPSQVSGGERQRCAFARAVVNSPKLIFADEPTGALDSASAISLMKIIASLNHTLHSNIFLVTHDALCASYADRVLFLKDGKIFSELVKGEKKNREFYHEILDNISLLGE